MSSWVYMSWWHMVLLEKNHLNIWATLFQHRTSYRSWRVFNRHPAAPGTWSLGPAGRQSVKRTALVLLDRLVGNLLAGSRGWSWGIFGSSTSLCNLSLTFAIASTLPWSELRIAAGFATQGCIPTSWASICFSIRCCFRPPPLGTRVTVFLSLCFLFHGA